MTLSALTIYESGLVATSELETTSTDHCLAALHSAIGCTSVVAVQLAPTITMWLDDEGAYTKNINELATAIARQHGITGQLYYFGTAVLTGGQDDQGTTQGLDAATLRRLAATLNYLQALQLCDDPVSTAL